MGGTGPKFWAALGLDLVTLRLFVAAAQENSFAAAAARERIAVSAISRRISDLEIRSGVKLFDRHDRGVSLTTAGDQLLQHLAAIFDQLDRVAWDLDAHRKGDSGYVRIHASMTAIAGHLPLALSRFQAIHPGIDFHISEKTSEEIVHALRTGMTDIGLTAGPAISGDLSCVPWHHDDLVVLLPSGHPLCDRDRLSLEDIIDNPFVCLQESSALMRLFRRKAEELGKKIWERVITTGFESSRHMVGAGMGVAIVPSVAADETSHCVVRPLAEDWARRQLSICVRDMKHLSAATKLLVDHLVSSRPG